MLRRLEGLLPTGSAEAWQASWSEPSRSIEEHVDRYRNSPVMHPSMPDEYKPVLFAGGKRQPFPAPTKAIRPPRIRHLKPSEQPEHPSPMAPLLTVAALAF
mmetsp:Transcript_77473/g.250693  ORF Transcript_77473/g.250693 Transcript_77473/m.250693 type:complete len:101 (+) Transcript_77473:106-408(+)